MPWGGSPPRPLRQKICYSDCTENCPLRPCEHNLQAPLFSGTWSARTRPEPTQGSWVGLIFQGDIQGISGSICESISGAAPSSLLPTGQENILAMTDSRSGRRSFDSKLISLLPLDEVPVHVHRFAARAPCDSKGSECQCGIHTAEAASALRSRSPKHLNRLRIVSSVGNRLMPSTCCKAALARSIPACANLVAPRPAPTARTR